MIISGEKTELRPLRPDDFAKIVTWSCDEEVNQYLEGDYPDSVEECSTWMQRLRSNRHAQHFVITTLEGELIGDIELDHITWRSGDAELRVRIGEKHLWDMGYGTDAVTALLTHAFNSMSLSRVYLRVFISNSRAIRCYEKAGFRKEGRLKRCSQAGRMEEILLMRILREEHIHRQENKEQRLPA